MVVKKKKTATKKKRSSKAKPKKKRSSKAKPKKTELEAKMAELGRQLATLENKARRAGAQTRKEIEATIRELRSRSDEVQEKVSQVKTAGAAALGDISSGLDSAIEELKEAYRKAASRFG